MNSCSHCSGLTADRLARPFHAATFLKHIASFMWGFLCGTNACTSSQFFFLTDPSSFDCLSIQALGLSSTFDHQIVTRRTRNIDVETTFVRETRNSGEETISEGARHQEGDEVNEARRWRWKIYIDKSAHSKWDNTPKAREGVQRSGTQSTEKSN